MTPPLAHPVQRVYVHPTLAPANQAEFKWLFDRTLQLRDAAFAMDHKAIHCSPTIRGTVRELKTASDDGAQRIYYTMLHGAVVVLAFHAKKDQRRLVGLVCGRCDDVHRESAAFIIRDNLLHA